MRSPRQAVRRFSVAVVVFARLFATTEATLTFVHRTSHVKGVSCVQGGSIVAERLLSSQSSDTDAPQEFFVEDPPAAEEPSYYSASDPASDTASDLALAEETQKTPTITVSGVAEALEYTAKLNERLQDGIRVVEGLPLEQEDDDSLRGGAIAAVAPTSEPTIFHAQLDRSDRWGAHLEPFLWHVAQVLLGSGANEGDDSLEWILAIAMIYLDRASSVETLRSSTRKVPFCTPQTVHRLATTALLLAVSAVRGMDLLPQLCAKVDARVGLSKTEFMVEWMRDALGDEGFFVSPEELLEWKLLLGKS